jgi:SHAQKYF class myb-like DNA-binding protein
MFVLFKIPFLCFAGSFLIRSQRKKRDPLKNRSTTSKYLEIQRQFDRGVLESVVNQLIIMDTGSISSSIDTDKKLTGTPTSDDAMNVVAQSPNADTTTIPQSHSTPGAGTVRIPPIESISGQKFGLNAPGGLGSSTGLFHIPATSVDSLHPIQTADPSARIAFRTPEVSLPPYAGSGNSDGVEAHSNPALSQFGAQFYASIDNPGGPSQEDDDDLDDDDGDTNLCPQGAEHTGRWTKKEHELFLEALKKYGKEWKKVAAMVKTRTVVQTRTHAQKYFQKVQKYIHPDGGEGGDGEVAPAMATASTAGAASQGKRSRAEMETSTASTASSKLPIDFDDDYFYYDTELPAHMRRTSDGPSGIGSLQHLDLPPPSPASCGKRKAAEVAVAQALSGSASPIDMERGIHTLAMMKEAVLRPRAGARGAKGATVRPMGGLSIINPDHLPSVKTEDEPHTPWDGEMKELEKKHKTSTMHVLVSTTAEQNEFISKVCGAAAMGDARALAKLLEAAKLSESLNTSGVSSEFESGDANGSTPDPAPTSAMAPPTPTSAAQAQAHASKPRSIVQEMLNRVNDSGESALMIACYDGESRYVRTSSGSKPTDAKKHSQQKTVDICKLLVDHGASTTLVNTKLRSCLHIAAEQGFDAVAKYLILKGCPVNGVDESGDTAAHLAARNGHINVLNVLSSCGANCHIRNNAARCALDVAQDCPDNKVTREEIRNAMLLMEPRLRSLILYHEDCLEHAARRESDWEGPDRLRGIMRLLLDSNEFPGHKVEISNQFEKAHVELLSRVHSPEYIAFVNTLSKRVQEESEKSMGTIPPVPFTPQVQKTMMRHEESATKHPEACDTSFSRGTLKAARRAAGAVAHAVDRVLLGRNRNAFCVVRPPGHHAGYQGLLDGAKSCGFCIFNSVAAGALHALEAHHCDRVAIIDIDVHHGNGTEDIVRRYQHPSRLFFFSCHLYDHTDGDPNEFFPGSGREDDTAHNIINVPILPMWKDAAANAHSTRSASKPTGAAPVCIATCTELLNRKFDDCLCF